MQSPAVEPAAGPIRKNIVAAYLLWFFFGFLGAHRFYIGRWRTGLDMAALFLLTLLGLYRFPVLIVAMLALVVWWLLDALALLAIFAQPLPGHTGKK